MSTPQKDPATEAFLEMLMQMQRDQLRRQEEATTKLGYSTTFPFDEYGLPGKSVTLNASLLIRQKIDEAGANVIAKLHSEKQALFDLMEASDDSFTLKRLALEVQDVEFKLQKAWKFPLDAKFHRFWEVPKCTCPKMDNDDAYPSGYYTVGLNCPVHGDC